METMIIGAGLAFFSALMFSSASILYKHVLSEEDPWLVTIIRTIPAFLSISLVAYIFGEHIYLSQIDPYILGLGVIAGAVGMLLASYFYLTALKEIGVSLGYPISFTYPVYVSVIAGLFLNEKLTIFTIMALTSTISGIILVSTRNKNGDVERNIRKGVLFAVIASQLWALSILVVKIALYSFPPIAFAVVRLATASLVSLVIILVNINTVKNLTPSNLGFISLGGIAGIGLGVAAAHVAISIIGASITSIVSASSPALSILLARIFFHEEMDKLSGLGVALVIIGTILSLL